jgi:catechol 2,3-dioxygenase-like lactoylglutathione lyase family enzyme
MPKVKAVDAVMLYSPDPTALAEWYATHLGIDTKLDQADGNRYGDIGDAEPGRVVHFGIYPAREWGRARRPGVMVNYQVEDFDGCLAALRANDVEVASVVEESYGRFAYIEDADGNPIEIWCARPRSAGA